MYTTKQILKGVCERFCPFYKAGAKEDSACRGLVVIHKLLDAHHTIKHLPYKGEQMPGEIDRALAENVCADCRWRENDCDYRDKSALDGAKPCGGVTLLALLLQDGAIKIGDIKSTRSKPEILHDQ